MKPNVLYAHAPERFVITMMIDFLDQEEKGGEYLLLMMRRGNQAANRMRREAAIVSADNVPTGGYASKR